MKHWDSEIAAIAARAPGIFQVKPDARVGIAVDDAVKRDYFVPRLQALLNKHLWTGTFRVVPMNGDTSVDLKAVHN